MENTAQKLFPKAPFLSVGIDGCKGKWLAAALSNQGFEVKLFDDIKEACRYYAEADSVLLDMPIGLPESPNEIRPEPELRKQLKGKSSSVFNVPCRQASVELTYLEASRVNLEVLGKKLSRQTFGIIPKIREVDVFLEQNPRWKNRLVESHPEYCFALLNNGSPILSNKMTREGSLQRLEILSKYYPDIFLLLKAFRLKYPGLTNKTDDLLDAAALSLVGAIALETGFYSVPAIPYVDGRGIKMQIAGAKVPALHSSNNKIDSTA